MDKWVYNFGSSVTEGNASMQTILGGKGANLGRTKNEKRPGKLGNTRMYCKVEGRVMTCLSCLLQSPIFSDKKKKLPLNSCKI